MSDKAQRAIDAISALLGGPEFNADPRETYLRVRRASRQLDVFANFRLRLQAKVGDLDDDLLYIDEAESEAERLGAEIPERRR